MRELIWDYWNMPKEQFLSQLPDIIVVIAIIICLLFFLIDLFKHKEG